MINLVWVDPHSLCIAGKGKTLSRWFWALSGALKIGHLPLSAILKRGQEKKDS
jgi:hypothetical protein